MIGPSPLGLRAQLDSTDRKSRILQWSALPMHSGKLLQSLNSQPTHQSKAVLPLKLKKVAGTAIYLSHVFHNFPGTFANH